VAGLRLVAESTGGRRNRIDTLLVSRAPEPSADDGAPGEEQAAPGPPGAGAPRADQHAGAVEG
jgi:hypothetical protein